MNALEVIQKFAFVGKVESCERYGSGHINETFLVVCKKCRKQSRYILQKLNTKIFPNFSGVMNNIVLVTEYIKSQIRALGGDCSRECMTVVYTLDGQSFWSDGNICWRAYEFVEDTIALQIADSPEIFGDSGRAFGKFIAQLDGFDATQLCEPIVNFHNTVDRYNKFIKAVEDNFSGRADAVKDEIDWVKSRQGLSSLIVDKLNNKEIPLRVTHNDTKLNNVLIDKNSGKAICVIDLDTIMPGSLLYDFGDSCRFGCSTAYEDEKDLSKVDFSLELYDAYCKGFLSGVGDKITQKEVEMLHYGAMIMTYECGMRFLTDYLNGDTYFKVHYADHNLDRAHTQFKLVERMEVLAQDMINIAKKYYIN